MFHPGRDQCLSIFGALYDRGLIPIPPHARVLEIGCAEADWMTDMMTARPDVTVTGIDWRRPDSPRPGTVIRGDVLTHDFPAAAFDAVVGISSIEHIGLGHYDDDPCDPDGDRHCMERVVRWLKPGGLFYADVPWRADRFHVDGTSHREYDDPAIRTRLLIPGLTERGRWYATGATVNTPTLDPPVRRESDHLIYVALIATKDAYGLS
jgi:hypothetical protein